MVQTAFCSRPMRDVPPSGDGWYCIKRHETIRIMLADGMGHGINAHRIVLRLVRQISWLSERGHTYTPIEECLASLSQYLKRLNDQSAQAAISISDIDTSDQSIRNASIGNIETLLVINSKAIRFPSVNGMVGGRMPSKLQINHQSIKSPSILAMFTDGVHSRIALQCLQKATKYSAPLQNRAQEICNELVERSRSIDDDASCAIALL